MSPARPSVSPAGAVMPHFLHAFLEPITAGALAEHMRSKATIEGDAMRLVRGVAPLTPGHVDALSFCDDAGASKRVAGSASDVVIVPAEAAIRARDGQTLLAVADPR